MMPFKSGLELTELQNMTVPEDDNISNDSNDFPEVENGQINSKFISDRESRRSLTNSHLEKKKCDEYIPGTTSLRMSVFNLSNAIMGSGILAGLGTECGCCMVYEKLGEQVFGTPGKMIVFGSTSLQNIGAMLSYLFIVKNELPSAIKFLMGKEEAFSAWYVDGRILVVAVTFTIILPLCLLKNLGYLGYTSGFSLGCMFFFLIVVIYKKFQLSCPVLEPNATSPIISNVSSAHEDMCQSKYVTCNSKTVYALPTLAFAFVCHPSVLPIYSELKDRTQKRMQMVSNISFFAMFVMYLMTAIFGYLTFYDNVHSDLLHNYQSRHDILILTVRVAVIFAVILTVPVLFFTVRSSLFELAKKTKYDLCHHVVVTLVLLVFINLLVIFIPSMKDIFGVVGVTSANMLIFILPSSLYLKITHQDTEKFTQRIWASLFLALGILFSLVSIPLVIYDWVHSGDNAEGN
uniref:Amino acid transporter transmembrane domain-containing protein n=1 Tax=Chelydra serpentina TaxID=8475 RepID=A0A8C3RPZ6_CHESE